MIGRSQVTQTCVQGMWAGERGDAAGMNPARGDAVTYKDTDVGRTESLARDRENLDGLYITTAHPRVNGL